MVSDESVLELTASSRHGIIPISWIHSKLKMAVRADGFRLHSFTKEEQWRGPQEERVLTTVISAHPTSRIDHYLRTLKQAGLRITPQRRAICHFLANTNRHPSAYQIFEELAATNPDISRATIYNTLNTLQELGAIVELSFGSDHTHYETNPEPHVNLICLRCQKITDYYGDPGIDMLTARVLADTDFQTAAARIDLVGFCDECRLQRIQEIRDMAKATSDQHKP